MIVKVLFEKVSESAVPARPSWSVWLVRTVTPGRYFSAVNASDRSCGDVELSSTLPKSVQYQPGSSAGEAPAVGTVDPAMPDSSVCTSVGGEARFTPGVAALSS